MQKDIRVTSEYKAVKKLCQKLRQPGTGQISDVAELDVASDGNSAVFSATIVDKLVGIPPTHVAQINLASGDVKVLTFGPNTDRLPKYAPDGKYIAFLSDRHKLGDFQLYLFERKSEVTHPAPHVEGWVEYLHWSPDGQRILLGVAGYGADLAGAQGAIPSKRETSKVPKWMPAVETGYEKYRWRHVWIYCLKDGSVKKVEVDKCNIWEAIWCGNDGIAAITSSDPNEADWYTASLQYINVKNSEVRTLYQANDQLGHLSVSADGKQVAIVEAIASDRCNLAGNLLLINSKTGKTQQIYTHKIDITYTEWLSDTCLLVGGHREFETVFAYYDTKTERLIETWQEQEISVAGVYAVASGLSDNGDCVFVSEGFDRGPAITILNQGNQRTVKSFDMGNNSVVKQCIDGIDTVKWQATDGLEIHGWLLRPKGVKPYPLVMCIHGGPVFHWHPRWLGRNNLHLLKLLERGYAIFLPNPRGSSGRGQKFIRHVVGDPGGEDCKDLLSGLDYLVKKGIADPERIGLIGGSYGGFMTSWLVTQDSRFAAAISVAPHTNQVTERLLSNIPYFVDLFYADKYNNPNGNYFHRSPIMYADQVKTPILNICGALDRCTPPTEAMQFHNALRENNKKSILLTYPQEGHGIRRLPATIDYSARILMWFDKNLNAEDIEDIEDVADRFLTMTRGNTQT